MGIEYSWVYLPRPFHTPVYIVYRMGVWSDRGCTLACNTGSVWIGILID